MNKKELELKEEIWRYIKRTYDEVKVAYEVLAKIIFANKLPKTIDCTYSEKQLKRLVLTNDVLKVRFYVVDKYFSVLKPYFKVEIKEIDLKEKK